MNQLDRFDINKPGLAVPEDGFSRLDVEAAIPLVREDMNILKGMTSLSFAIWKITRFDGLAKNCSEDFQNSSRKR